MLFTARWNIPRAARHIDVTDDEMKELFRQHCKNNPPYYEANGQHV